MKFAELVFKIAAVYGVIVLFPLYFLESYLATAAPPPMTHPETYYGFIGAALAFQTVYFLIGTAPVRYRAFMLPASFAKLTYSVALIVLFMFGRVSSVALAAGMPDLLLAILFAISFAKVRRLPAA